MNLKQIAKLAGVSTATVSNVINGNFHKVSEGTRHRVEQIIRETDYKPNEAARSLVTRESRIIGLVVPYIGVQEDFLSNPYYAHMIALLERNVRNRDYYLMLRCVGHGREIIPLLSSWNVAGAVFLGILESEVGDIAKGLFVPMVFMDTYAKNEKIVNVGVDDYRGGFLSARYLAAKGHQKIALACPDPEIPGVVRERFLGFQDGCKEAGIRFTKRDIFRTDSSYHSAIKVGQDLAFSNGYTAAATFSDIAAFGVIEGLRQCGKSVPEDLSVIGFDDLPESDFLTVKLTTIAQDFEKKANTASEYLFRMIEGERELCADERLAIRVVERQSVRGLNI